ncbi:MAG: DUF3592 domain-containing protein [Actinomycetota bacterium]|nr:DUF3592 domain-containing protein [Actinomycetota bacterium]
MGIDTSTITVVAPLVVLALVGVSLLLRTQKSSSARSVASDWPHTMGTVLSASVQVSHSGNSRHETPLVLYAYQVNGQLFQGHRVRVGDEYGRVRVAGTDSSASNTVARYQAGASVVVFYDPSNPSNSALER